jgi:hypothetical protein
MWGPLLLNDFGERVKFRFKACPPTWGNQIGHSNVSSISSRTLPQLPALCHLIAERLHIQCLVLAWNQQSPNPVCRTIMHFKAHLYMNATKKILYFYYQSLRATPSSSSTRLSSFGIPRSSATRAAFSLT